MAQLDREVDELSPSLAKRLSATRDIDLVMLAEYSTSVLDETDTTRKLNEEGDELSLSGAVSEENLSTTRDLSETDTIVDTLLRGTVMD